MSIIIFGCNGMAGKYINSVLFNTYKIICISRREFDIETDNWDKLEDIISSNLSQLSVIINCAGIIPQKICQNEYKSYIRVNSLFPHKLQEICNKNHISCIHITTDCVYSGRRGNYIEIDEHDEKNIYGISKSLGEPNDSCIIRTSIIGEDKNSNKGLLEWVKSNANNTIDGYSNHYWNGITCLTLANIIKEIIDKNLYWTGVRHIFSNSVSKYDICCYINEIYKLNIKVNKIETLFQCNRTLKSIFNNTFNIDSIEQQIMDIHNYRTVLT